ncbi:MAG: hypothetical protein ACJAU0_000976 [Flavobacteriales bacterium]|jgi:hypothetical protein
MLKHLICLLFAASLHLSSLGQSNLELLEGDIVRYQTAMSGLRDDAAMLAYSDSLRTAVISALNSEGAFDYPFSKVKSMSILMPESKAFRLFNWNIPLMDQTHDYACFILIATDRKKGLYNWVELKNTTSYNANVAQKYLTAEKWQGALYYKIIELKKGKKIYYTLLGWDGADGMTNRKVIEILQFNGGKIRFGAPIFKMEKANPKRYTLAYAEEVMVSLKFDEKEERIVFDHLSPRVAGLEGNPAFMGPDLTFDAFIMEKGKWVFASDIYVTLGKEDKRPYFDPRKR